MVHKLGGPTIHQKSAARHVKGGDQLLKDEATDDEVVTTTHIRLKDDTKRIHPFEKQPCPEDEPLPLAEDGWEYVPRAGGRPARRECHRSRGILLGPTAARPIKGRDGRSSHPLSNNTAD